jgi:WD40 repeat protein
VDADQARVAFLDISPDGRWIAMSPHKSGVRIWDRRSGELLPKLTGERETCRMAFSPDGRWLAISMARDFEFWEVGSWKQGRRILRDAAGRAAALAFSPDSRILAIASARHVVRLIDVETGEPVATLESSHPQYVAWLCFSPDGSHLAVACANHTIRVWNLRTMREQLAAMGLDWDLPPYPPATEMKPREPLTSQLLPE